MWVCGCVPTLPQISRQRCILIEGAIKIVRHRNKIAQPLLLLEEYILQICLTASLRTSYSPVPSLLWLQNGIFLEQATHSSLGHPLPNLTMFHVLERRQPETRKEDTKILQGVLHQSAIGTHLIISPPSKLLSNDDLPPASLAPNDPNHERPFLLDIVPGKKREK